MGRTVGALMKHSLLKNAKKGFGIMEVLVAIAVLGFLYVAVNNLQSGNRDTLLRIRGRDGAVEVAQQVIDSLSRVGIATLSKKDTISIPQISRTWKGQPGVVQHDMTVNYSAQVVLSPDSTFKSKSASAYDTVSHVFAKRLDVTVSWPFKSSTQSISVSRIVR
jgi:prepilin-type N-terminal cleavage/methylation domain-containing protein